MIYFPCIPISHLEYSSSLGRGRGFISFVSLALWSADSVGSFADDDEDTEWREFGLRYREKKV